jgi:transposase
LLRREYIAGRRGGPSHKITRRWAKRGSRPSAPNDQRTASTYIFGAICPKEGKGAALVMPRCDTVLLPPKCPELNPVENIWQYMRDNWLSNRVFNSYDDILNHCCYSWNKLIDQTWRIMSIGLRDWAHGF